MSEYLAKFGFLSVATNLVISKAVEFVNGANDSKIDLNAPCYFLKPLVDTSYKSQQVVALILKGRIGPMR